MRFHHRFFGQDFALLAILLTVVCFTYANLSSPPHSTTTRAAVARSNETSSNVTSSNETSSNVNTTNFPPEDYGAPTKKDDDPDMPKWVIIAMAASGIVLLLLIIAMMVFCFVRRRKNRKPELTYMKSDKASNANSSYLEFSSAASDTQ